MTVNIISDIHATAESGSVIYEIDESAIKETTFINNPRFEPEKLEPADYLIIAGDIGYDDFYEKIVADLEKRTTGKFKKILHIAGNHDHWIWTGNPDGKPGIDLRNDFCEHIDGDYVFIGCTLWTHIPLRAQGYVSRRMNDYIYIPHFTCDKCNEVHEQQKAWLFKKLEEHKDKKVVVFTHHQPFPELMADDYEHRDVQAAYTSLNGEFDDANKFGNIVLWACGHSHGTYDGILHGIRCIKNSIGYRSLYTPYIIYPEIPPDHWYDNVIEI